MKLLRQSLSMKLIVAILVMAIPIFLLSLGLLFVQSRYIIRQEATEHASSILSTTIQRLGKHLQAVKVATEANEWVIMENLQPDSLLLQSKRVVQLNGRVSGCSISFEPDFFPQEGRYFSVYTVRMDDSLVNVREGPYEYFEKEWYMKPRKLGEACWTDPFNNYYVGDVWIPDLIASYGKPLYLDGRFIGVLSTDVSMQKLSQTIREEQPYPHSYFMMIGSNGKYFIHPDTTLLFNHTIFEGADPSTQSELIALGHEMTSGNNGSMQVSIDGEPCLVCYHHVPDTGWSLALVCPERDVLQSYHKLALIIVALIVAGMLIILILCYKVVTYSIRPLNQLEAKMQRLAAGEYETHIPRTKRNDAVGNLQNSFGRMLQSLNFHLGSIRYTSEHTQQRNEELALATQKAEEAVRQKALFIQNMTHQIRTPLNIISGFAQVMRDNLAQLSEEELKSIGDMMDHNAKSLFRMVAMLFDSSETGASEELKTQTNELVACNEVARESIENTYEHFPDIVIGFETDAPDSFSIHSNRLYLIRSLRELLYNASKYSDRQHISLIVKRTPDTVRFICQDTGTGIDEAYRSFIYMPFVKVNDLSEGLGLGLPLAKRHAQTLGGDLIFDTAYQDGCRFILELPIS